MSAQRLDISLRSSSPQVKALGVCLMLMAAPPPFITANGVALTIEDAGHIISRYLQSFGQNPSTCRQTVTYTTIPVPNPPTQFPPPSAPSYSATVTLPPCAGFTSSFATAGSYPSKLMAKRVACFDACKALLDKGELDDDLKPRPGGGPPKEKKARGVREGRDPASLARWVEEGDRALGADDEDLERGLSLSARWEVFKGTIKARLPDISPGVGAGPGGVGEYEELVPEGLDEVVGRRPWMSILRLSDERALAFLTAKRLVDDEEEMELKAGWVMKMTDAGQLKKLSEEQLDLAKRYTEQAIRSQMNKDLHIPTGPCWLLVPIVRTFAPTKTAKRTDIDWAEMSSTLTGPSSSPFTLSSPSILAEEMMDAVATNPAEFGRRFFVESFTDLTLYSPYPYDPTRTILERAFARSTIPEVEYPDQHVFTASISNSGRSGGILNPPPSTAPVYFMPEFTRRYCFSASAFRALSAIPTFFVMLTDLLAAKQLNARIFDNKLTPALALQAITPAMSAPNQPNRSYERLEILGDTLIKLLTTLDTCIHGPLSDQSRVDRHILLSNRSLRAGGVQAGIAPYIRLKEGRARAWIPEGWGLGSENTAEAAKRTVKVGDKVVADVVEALVGASYMSSNRSLDAAISTMKRLNIPVDRMDSWADVSKIFEKRSSLDLQITPSEEGGKKVAKNNADGWMTAFTKPVAVCVLGYTFRDPEKSDVVFNGSSQTRGRQDFQQYKIIGDSLMDYFAVERLYDMEECYNPAIITHMKHSRVQDQALAAMSVVLGLADRVVEVDKPVQAVVARYKQQLEARWKEAENVLKRSKGDGDVSKAIEFWMGSSHAPTLGAIPEVLLGAIVADQNGDLGDARKVFIDHFWPFMEKFGVGPINHSLHPKSVMQEKFGKYGCTVWKIVRLDEKAKGIVCAIEHHGQEIARAMAESQNLATRAACEKVLEILTEDMVRAVCTCGYTAPLPSFKE